MAANDGMEHRVLRVAGPIRGVGKRHAPGAGGRSTFPRFFMSRNSNPQVQYHLGIVPAAAGDKKAARQALSAAAASPTPFPGQDEAKNSLAALK